MTKVLVYGLAVAGAATLRALVARGADVVVSDDDLTPERRALAAASGATVVAAPGAGERDADDLVASVDLVCPAPGVP